MLLYCSRRVAALVWLAMFVLQGCSCPRVATNREKEALLRGDSFNSPFGIDDKIIAADGKLYVDYVYYLSGKDHKKGLPPTDGFFTKRMKDAYEPVKIINGIDVVSGAPSPYALFLKSKKEKKRYMLAFRGTEFADDFLADLDDTQISFVNLGGREEKGVRVHRGFFEIYNSLRKEVFRFLLEEKVEVLDITCHSLGCGMAMMFLYDSVNAFDSVGYIKKTNFYSYGAPRSGGRAFVSSLVSSLEDSRSEINYANFINYKDVVPKLPSRAQGFRDYPRPGSFGLCFTKSSLSKPNESMIRFYHDYYPAALQLELLGEQENADYFGVVMC